MNSTVILITSFILLLAITSGVTWWSYNTVKTFSLKPLQQTNAPSLIALSPPSLPQQTYATVPLMVSAPSPQQINVPLQETNTTIPIMVAPPSTQQETLASLQGTAPLSAPLLQTTIPLSVPTLQTTTPLSAPSLQTTVTVPLIVSSPPQQETNAPQQQYVTITGVNYSLNDITHIPNSTNESCKALCTANGQCVGAVMGGTTCWLKSSFQNANIDNSTVALFPVGKTNVTGIDYGNNDILPVRKVSNVTECRSICNTTPGCIGAVYDGATNCYLKSALVPTSKNPNLSLVL